MIRVVNKRTYIHRIGEASVYIGRPSILGNPFRISVKMGRTQAIEKYRVWLRGKIKERTEVWEQLVRIGAMAEMQDIALVCYCKPLSCHGDVIKKYIEEGKI